ncbi:MAG: protein-arginine deiminase family protein [Phormidesmis sp.]
MKSDKVTRFELGKPIAAPLDNEGSLRIEALSGGSHQARLVHLSPSGERVSELVVKTYDHQIALSVDSNRDGQIDQKDIGRANWVYGEAQQGAILLFNNDLDISDGIPTDGQKSEWSRLLIDTVGTGELPDGVSLVLQVPTRIAECCAIYRQDGEEFHHILGKNLQDKTAPAISVSAPLPTGGITCYIEAHEYPGDLFEGLISLELLLKQGDETVASDRAVYRVAPWIMTPHTLPPAEVYACEMENNQQFLSDLKSALKELDIPLTVVPQEGHRGDRWIQDEIEFGYVQSPTHILPVVFDSPRDGGLDDYPELDLLGPDFGHFQVGDRSQNSLDSFGNLEVSPPVTVKGRHYPFGRIVFGGRQKGDYSETSRQMMPKLRHFLYAQKIQAPFELFTDWLLVGHVDEIISFIPADNDQGFQVLVASPLSARNLLQKLSLEGHGNTPMFEGLRRSNINHPPGTVTTSAEITVDELLADTTFWENNHRYQSYMDSNLHILSEELGIGSNYMTDIPVLFYPPLEDNDRAVAYFPNMINHLVLDNSSLVPKPRGPIINGKCAFEAAFEQVVPTRNVRFIEGWDAYHDQLGDVHCGTNTRRHPFPNSRWWEYKPDGGFDI